jgi:hypothetical protein
MNRRQPYTVQTGDSIASIAKRVGFGDNWKPLFVFNRKIRKQLKSDDPDKLAVGTVLFIPKTKLEYDDAISRLRILAKQLEQDKLSELENLKKDYKDLVTDVSKHVDIAADVAMAGKGIVKASVKLGKRYATVVAKKEILKASNSVLEKALDIPSDDVIGVTGKASSAAVTDNALIFMSPHKVSTGKFLKSGAKDFGKQASKAATTMAVKAAVSSEAASGAANLASIAFDFVAKGIDAIAPSEVAVSWVYITTGDTPEDSLRKAVANVEKGYASGSKIVTRSILELFRQKDLLYS